MCKRFDAVVGEAELRLAEYQIPGAAVGILSDGQERYAGLGVTSVENPLPVDEDTLFQAGSITKTLTATAALRLSQSGALDLDAPVRQYLPDLRLADDELPSRSRCATCSHTAAASRATSSTISGGATMRLRG